MSSLIFTIYQLVHAEAINQRTDRGIGEIEGQCWSTQGTQRTGGNVRFFGSKLISPGIFVLFLRAGNSTSVSKAHKGNYNQYKVTQACHRIRRSHECNDKVGRYNTQFSA